ncbi:LEPR-XLL domain-containing protein, partial [Ramlibacter sp. USB13]
MRRSWSLTGALRQVGARALSLSRIFHARKQRTHAARARPPFRRKVLFEMLEQRLLMSGDPLVAAQDGILTASLTDGADTLVVTQVGTSAGGGVIVDLTVGGVTNRWGDDSAGLSTIVVRGGEGDDSFRFVDVTAGVDLLGGGGTDALEWDNGDATWTVNAAGAGLVGTAGFGEIENLQGADGNQDHFVVSAAGSIAGTISGGEGGHDTLTLDGGSFGTVRYSAWGPLAGEIQRGGDVLRYTGLEPIVDNTTAAQRIFELTAGDDPDALLAAGGAGRLVLSGSTFESIDFLLPASSLTIEGGDGADGITLGTLELGGTDLTVRVESIHVPTTSRVATSGNVSLRAEASAETIGSASPDAIEFGAQVLVEGEMEVGGALVLEAVVDNTVTLAASGSNLQVESSTEAVARIAGTAHVTAGTLTVSSLSQTNVTVTVTDAPGGTSGVGSPTKDSSRPEVTLLTQDGPAKFYLWGKDTLDYSKATYVVVHGWMGDLDTSYYDLINAAQEVDPEANVVFVDWGEWAKNPIYPEAADDTYAVGGLLANFLATRPFDPQDVTLIGHSLGGQVSGVAGGRYQDLTGNALARIYALDPAGPNFEETLGIPAKALDHRLDMGDADRVVVLHTTTTLGFDGPAGHLDLYVNPDSPTQPGAGHLAANHSYSKTLMAQLLRGETFGEESTNLVGEDLSYADFLDASLAGSADVETISTPLVVVTLASIDGGAHVVTGTEPISGSESASLLVQAHDEVSITLDVTTASLAGLSADDYVEGLLGLDRDTTASIGDALQRADVQGGIVKVGAANSGSIATRVASGLLEFRATTFVRDDVAASVTNADLDVTGLEVRAVNTSAYASEAEENGTTARGEVRAAIDDSTVTADAGGITVEAEDASSYVARSLGEGDRSSYNDVRKDVAATATASTLASDGGSIVLSADNTTSVTALSTLSATSPVFGAANVSAINVVNGSVIASVEDSSLGTTGAGSVSVTAVNAASIDSRVVADATAASLAVPVPTPALAFGSAAAYNAVGWSMYDVLAATVEDLLGDPAKDWIENLVPFGVATPMEARAFLQGTTVLAAGALTVRAQNAAQVNATVSNAAQSTASSLFGTFGGAGGGVLASNKVASGAEAYAQDVDLTAGGALAVQASDDAGIYSNSKFVASSITTNDGGLRTADQLAGLLLDSDHASTDGVQDVAFGDTVYVADGYAVPTRSSDHGLQSVGTGTIVGVAGDYLDADYDSEYGNRALVAGDKVQVLDGYANGGEAGAVYVYTGAGGVRDLSAQDYSTGPWVKIGGEAGASYRYVGGAGTRDLGVQDYGDTALWRKIAGTSGSVYEYMGTAASGAGLDLGVQDYSDQGFWKEVPETQYIPQGINFTQSGSVALGGMVVLNDVRASVRARIENAIVEAASLSVEAVENAVIRAKADNSTSSSGGSTFTGQGTSLAVNGTIASNMILSAADAHVADSEVTVTGGDASITAANTSDIQATTLSAATSGANAVGVLLAFNTIGWQPSGVLFSSVDALVGDPLIANALAASQPASVTAHALDTTFDVDGALELTAASSAQVSARVGNEATSAPSAFLGAGGMSAAFVLSSNMVNSTAEAYIDFTTAGPGNTVQAGSVSVHAEDSAGIAAESNLLSAVAPTNDAGAGLINNLAGVLLDDYQYTSNSGVVDVTFGQRVRVADDFADADRAGKVY